MNASIFGFVQPWRSVGPKGRYGVVYLIIQVYLMGVDVPSSLMMIGGIPLPSTPQTANSWSLGWEDATPGETVDAY